MYNFCTLFDSFYLVRGLTMYRSLEKVCSDFHLYIFAFDNKSFDLLTNLKLEKATVISLREFEDKKLLDVKPTRTKAEYCWTCTPSTILFCIEKFGLENCTYIDADLYFYEDPKVLFDEMGSKSILLTEHRYPPKFNRTNTSGIYCVQFITFRNDENGMTALRWWRDACIEWCYNRYENGKFGDQKYLDDWTSRFKGVHVLQHLGGGLAPWNVEQYKFLQTKNNHLSFLDRSSSKQFEAVFYHFHYVRFFKNDRVDLGWRHPTMPVVINVYAPYILELNRNEAEVKKIDPAFSIPRSDFKLLKNEGLKDKLKFFYKKYLRYNIFKTGDIIARYEAQR